MGRSKKNKTEDKRLKFNSLMKIIAGVDEVGRGSLIGPVSYTHLTLPTIYSV